MNILTEPVNNIQVHQIKNEPPATAPLEKEWTPVQKIAFRIALIFVTLVAIPLDVGFYRMLWYIDYAHLNYRHLTDVFVFYNPQFINHFSDLVASCPRYACFH